MSPIPKLGLNPGLRLKRWWRMLALADWGSLLEHPRTYQYDIYHSLPFPK